MNALLDFASYVPHGYCLFWAPWLVALYAGSDLLIFAAYSMIPVALIVFLRRRPDIRFRGLVALFAAFILLCGVTHLISVITLWVPIYPIHALSKLVTGIVSAVTAVVLFRLIPRLVEIPSPHQLQLANDRLRTEIVAHEATLAELRSARTDLEAKVARRTAELTEANARLAVSTREAVHRGRNLLSIATSLARQTARQAADVDTLIEDLLGRIDALSNATAAVAEAPSADAAELDEVVRRQLMPALLTYGDRIRIEGPEVSVSAEGAQQIALALHELATNAIKYGALAGPEGVVRLSWTLSGSGPGQELSVVWREEAPTRPAPEARSDGFGTTLLTRAVPATLRGVARREFGPDGLTYELRAPIASLAPPPADPNAPAPVDAGVWSGGRLSPGAA